MNRSLVDIYQSVIQKSRSLTFPSHEKFILGKGQTDDFKREVYEILVDLFSSEFLSNGLRIFHNGSRDTETNLEILKKSFKGQKEIDNWFNNSLFESETGIIINSIQKYHEGLKRKFSILADWSSNTYGVPSLGFDIGLFIGNYGYTPLGIHKDAPGSSVTHFHLGPGTKRMYLFDEDVYEKTISDNLKLLRPEEFLNKTQRFYKEFIIQPGDVFFMPESKYHIGYTPEFSIALTFWRQESRLDDYKFIFKQDLQEILFKKNIVQTQNLFFKKNHFKSSLASNSKTLIKDELINMSLSKIIDLSSEIAYKKMLSNGYFVNKGKCRRAIKLSPNDKLILQKNFKIQYQIFESFIMMIIRGYEVLVPKVDEITECIDMINEEQIVKFRDLFKVLNEELDNDFIDYFINQLYIHHGVDIES